MATPPRPGFPMPPIPNLPSPSGSGSRPRGSFSSSFSFDPSHLVHSYANHTNVEPSFSIDPNRSLLMGSPMRSSPHRARKGKEPAGNGRGHPLAQDMTADEYLDSDVDESYVLNRAKSGVVERMRSWRQDAMWQHLYETAAFWGDKIFSWTNDKNDAFWLAQIYFSMHQYSRAERLLTRPFNDEEATTPLGGSFPTLAASGSGGDQNKLRGLSLSGPSLPFSRMAQPLPEPLNFDKPPPPFRLPGELDEPILTQRDGDASCKLVDLSVACRYLAAQCQIRQGKWSEATEMLGEANPFRGPDGSRTTNMDISIQIEASMCCLRGMLKLKLNRAESAKECFMEALAIDVKCYEAFDQLISGEMMTADEEWEFVQSLCYKQQIPEDAEFVQLIYTSRLRKYKHVEEHAITRQKLVEQYALKDNVDVLFSFADAAYAQFKWADCFAFTQRILSLVNVHEHTMPLHIACMHHLPNLHSKLFILAHELVEKEPEAAMSWYAVGVWYLTSKKWAEARTYFSKTSLMDPRFAPAWIAFAHTFAFEGEHDHAVVAYSTCARLFAGSHLPLTFVGMEHIMLSNFDMADESLAAADKMCNSDPLLLNERGVMAFNRGNYEKAASLLQQALTVSEVSQSSNTTWATTYVNLGTALGKLERYEEACATYKKVLEIDPRHATALAFMGKMLLLMGKYEDAILKFHESLSVDPINGHVVEMLNLALDISFTKEAMPKSIAPLWHPELLKEAEAVKHHTKARNARRTQHRKTWRDKESEEAEEMSIG